MIIRKHHRWILAILLFVITAAGALIWRTNCDFLPLPESLALDTAGLRKVQIVDRNYVPLTVTAIMFR